MITLAILGGISIFGIILFIALKEEAKWGGAARCFACIGLLLPFIMVSAGLMISNFVTREWQLLKENRTAIQQDIIIAQQSGVVTDDLVEKIAAHNKHCDRYYEDYQSSVKYSFIAKSRTSALDFKLEQPSIQSVSAEVGCAPTEQQGVEAANNQTTTHKETCSCGGGFA